MKVLFLDMDGVLNNQQAFLRDRPKGLRYWAPENVAVFKNMMKRLPDVKIVISSAWRINVSVPQFNQMLKAIGVKNKVIGITPAGLPNQDVDDGIIIAHARRGHEIAAWLKENPQVKKFVILDDSDDMAHLIDRLVHTRWASGLLQEHADEIIRRFA
jgi:hypothetical protein